MNKQNENLDELLNGFYDKQQAEQFKSNLEFTSRILDVTASPKPSKDLLNNIKADLNKYHQNKLKLRFKLETVAAVLIIGAIFLSIFTGPRIDKPDLALTTNIWQNSNFTLDDSELFEIENTLNDISDQLITMEDDDNGYELANSLAELETDFIDLDENFWKG